MVNSQPYKDVYLKDPILKFECGGKVYDIEAKSEIKITIPTITPENEYMNTIISIVAIAIAAVLILV